MWQKPWVKIPKSYATENLKTTVTGCETTIIILQRWVVWQQLHNIVQHSSKHRAMQKTCGLSSGRREGDLTTVSQLNVQEGRWAHFLIRAGTLSIVWNNVSICSYSRSYDKIQDQFPTRWKDGSHAFLSQTPKQHLLNNIWQNRGLSHKCCAEGFKVDCFLFLIAVKRMSWGWVFQGHWWM